MSNTILYEKYTLSSESPDGKSSITIYLVVRRIFILFIADYIYGLIGEYYLLDTVTCNNNLPNYDVEKIKTIRLDNEINFEYNENNTVLFLFYIGLERYITELNR